MTTARWLANLQCGVLLALPHAALADGMGTHLFGNPDLWQWPPSRTYHVENYRLTLHFDEPRGEVFGDEVVTLRPFQGHFRSLYLDSSELTIEAVTLQLSGAAPVTLKYATQGARLWITLDREYDAGSALNVRIAYHGFPRAGLYFVNPTPVTRSPRRRSTHRAKPSSITTGFRAGTIRTISRPARRSRRFPTGKPWFPTASW